MCKTISQKVRFKADPADVYRLLVDDDEQVGRPFHIGEGTGIVVDLAPAERVVRAWREVDYPEGVFSMAAVTLRPVDTGTELKLTHRGVPKALIPRTEARWRQDYWEPMKQKLRGTLMTSDA
jgi:uncharacterized protein YndB with AHSA1/START domain